MPIDWNEWGPPLAVLGIGIVGAIALVVRGRAVPAPAVHTTELEARRDAAVAALRELDLEKDKLAPDEYEAQKKALLAEGAAALRALEQGPAAAPVASEAFVAALTAERTRLGDAAFARAIAPLIPGLPTARAEGIAPEWKGALYATIAFLGVGALAWSAGDIAKPRGDGGMNGGPGGGMQAEPERIDTTELEAKVAANPNDVDALNRLTMAAMQNRDPGGAMGWSEKALAAAPKDPTARLNRALLTAEMGMAEPAIAKIDEVLVDAPDMPEAHLYRGLLLLMTDKAADAVPSLEKAVALGLDSPMVRQALAEARGKAGLPGGAVVAAPPGATPAPGSDEIVIQGTIDVDPAALAAVQGASVVYVSVKDGAGPPLAAKKLPVGPFPMTFSLTMADRPPMAGNRPVPASFDVTVRADRDGNAMTKDPTEPVVVLPGVAKGQDGLAIVLKSP